MNRRLSFRTRFVFLALLAAVPVLADEPAVETIRSPQNVRLNEVLVSPNRSGEQAMEAPYATDLIDHTQSLERAYRSIPESLQNVAGVMGQATSPGQGSPFIRGFTGYRNLFLIDGIRLNNSVFRAGPNQYWNTVDHLSIDTLEVLKGPSSVLYGSDAIGGTVSAFTMNPYAYGEADGFAGRSYYRVSSAENSHQGRIEFSHMLDPTLGVLYGLSGKHYGDVIGGDQIGRQTHTGYDEWNGDIKFEKLFSDNVRVIFAHQTVEQNNVPRTHTTIHAKSFDGSAIGSDRQRESDQDRYLTYLQLHAEELGGAIDTVRASISWHEAEEVQDRIRSSGARSQQGFDVGTFGVWVQAESPSELGRWTYGLEYYHDHINSFATSGTGSTIQGPVGDDGSYDLFGLYLQNLYELNPSDDLIFGVRYNYAAARSSQVFNPSNLPAETRMRISEDWDSFVGSFRWLHRIDPDHLHFYAGVSQGYRAPSFSDLTLLDDTRSGETEIPSPDLEPEFFITYEVGLKQKSDHFSSEMAYYWMDIQDMIQRTPTGTFVNGSPAVLKDNSGDGWLQGIEYGMAWNFSTGWTLFGNIAWMDGEVDAFPSSTVTTPVTEYPDRLMPLTSQLGLRYDFPNNRIWIEGLVIAADHANKLSSRDATDTQRIPPGGTPSYEVVHIRGGYRLDDNTTLTVAVENVTDEDYRIHGSGTNMPGANFIMGLEVRF